MKKKTAWYVLCRAVREKSVHMMSAAKRGGSAAAASREAAAKTSRRLEQIQKWLGFSDEYMYK